MSKAKAIQIARAAASGGKVDWEDALEALVVLWRAYNVADAQQRELREYVLEQRGKNE